MKQLILYSLLFVCVQSNAQLAKVSGADSVLGHKLIHDNAGITLAWYKPETPGAAYSHVMKLASEFLINKCPVDSKTGLPFYLVTCCFSKPDLYGNKYVSEDWPHNPACFNAGSVESFAVDYYTFSGDRRLVDFVRVLLDYQIDHGSTPTGWIWPRVPYASADPFEKEYHGATRWESQGFRGDGLHGIEPDKVGELGYGYLRFYQITEDKKYLNEALNCANALANNVRTIPVYDSPFIETKGTKSPWPFRVNARTGLEISDYCSNVLEPIKLFDELLRLKTAINLDTTQIKNYKRAREIAWNWLFSRSGPTHTYIWNAYFEDIPNDATCTNRLQITPGELGKYLIKTPGLSTLYEKDITALISWIASVFKTDGYDAIKEQTWCYEPMGSHTARYGSLCALWYEKTGNEYYREQAFRFLNFASYMTLPDGFVAVGPNWPGAWFSDGYSDYVRHFADALAAVPEWAPLNENHVLRSTSIIQSIDYNTAGISLQTYDSMGSIKCVLIKRPKKILVENKPIKGEWKAMKSGGILTFSYDSGHNIKIQY